MKIFSVGGAVRDKLLGLPVKDRDWVVVGATPQQMLDQGFRPVGKDFPVYLHPRTAEEYALARTERKSGKGHTAFQFTSDPGITLEEDLARRDLTINAIAEDHGGQLIDPYGGQRDIADKVLRHVSPAFAEDPLRVLRVARFAARYRQLGFRVADETLALMKSLTASGELEELSAERVWQETDLALSETSPRTYIEVLRTCGALRTLFPEVDRLFGVPQRADYHPEVDTGLHILLALDQATALSDSAAVRFAVLVHDLGKGITPADILPRHIGHEEGGVPLVNQVCDRLRVPQRYRQLAVAVTRYHLLCHKIESLRPATILKVLKGLDAFRQPDNMAQFLLACEADARGRTGFADRPYPSAAWLNDAFAAVRDLSAQEFVEGGLTGGAIGKALDTRRLEMLAAFQASGPVAHADPNC